MIVKRRFIELSVRYIETMSTGGHVCHARQAGAIMLERERGPGGEPRLQPEASMVFGDASTQPKKTGTYISKANPKYVSIFVFYSLR